MFGFKIDHSPDLWTGLQKLQLHSYVSEFFSALLNASNLFDKVCGHTIIQENFDQGHNFHVDKQSYFAFLSHKL